MRKYSWLVLIPLLLALPSAWAAISLQQAKSKGWIGELYTGYIALTPNGEKQQGNVRKELDNLVRSINKRRKAAYQEIASDEGLSLKKVESLAGEKTLNKTPSGQYIQLPRQGWQAK